METFLIFLFLVPMATVDDNWDWGRVSDTFVTGTNYELNFPCVTAVLTFHILGLKSRLVNLEGISILLVIFHIGLGGGGLRYGYGV